ncbi:MAG: Amuc_1100 family pilus-like protein [Candidatus Omnitrophota bacterium]
MTKAIKKSASIKVILVIIFALSLAYLVFAAYQSVSLRDSIRQKNKELSLYENEGLESLKKEEVGLGKQLEAIKNSYAEITGLLIANPRSRMPGDVEDPLKFKEELYKAQGGLRDRGKPASFVFPFWLGFDNYEHDIPTSVDLPIRIKQLDIISEICDLMLNSGVSEVTFIKFEDARSVFINNGKDIAYREFPLKIGFNCNNGSLISFLYGLSVSEIPLKIESAKLASSDAEEKTKGVLSAEFVIVAAIFP